MKNAQKLQKTTTQISFFYKITKQNKTKMDIFAF